MEISTTATMWRTPTKRRAIAGAVAGAGALAAMLFCRPTAEIVLSVVGWSYVFLMPSFPVCLAIWRLGRKRVQWNKLDFLILLAPYLTWMILCGTVALPKSLSNLVVELFLLGLAVNLAPIIRLTLPRRWNGKTVAAILLMVMCAVAAGIYFSVPCLPE